MAVSKGIQTTEFLLTVVVNVASIVGTLSGIIPASWGVLIMAVITSVYTIMRSIVKINDPNYVPPDLPVATPKV